MVVVPQLRAGWRSWSSNARTAVCFAGLLAAARLALNTRPATTQAAWMSWASTNLVNLRAHPIRCLLASAFLTDDQPLAWVAVSLVGLSSAGRVLGNARTALVVASAHVVATLVSEGLIAHAISVGSHPASDRLVIDVGPSYVVVSALAVGIAYGTWPARIASAVGFVGVAPYLFGGLWHGDVWALGHATAIAVGLGLAFPLRRSWSRHLVERL
jgi:hypothetical protein